MEIIAIVGVGYVGSPLAVAFGKKLPTIGYDLSDYKIGRNQPYIAPRSTVTEADMRAAIHLRYTTEAAYLALAGIIIIAVPTLIHAARKPDFCPPIRASESAGAHLKIGATVIYEFTVYPGATEEVCIPIPVLVRASELQWNRDFSIGDSPKRINPGSTTRRPTPSSRWQATAQKLCNAWPRFMNLSYLQTHKAFLVLG